MSGWFWRSGVSTSMSHLRQARVEIAAQLVAGNGRIIAARIFSASEPVAAIAGAEPPQALDRALGRLLPQLVGWAAAAS